MPDMQGKTVVITGVIPVSGSTAAALVSMGARVLVTARNANKGRTAVETITQRSGGEGRVQLVVFDLADLASVRRGAAEILEQAPRIDVLVNNAGLVLSERFRNGGRLRGDLCDQPPRTLPPDQLAPGTDHRIGAVPCGERGVHGPQHGPEGNALRRPAIHAALPGHAGVRPVEAGQHLVHVGAGPAFRREGRHSELPPPGHGPHRLWRRRRCPRPARSGHKDREPLLPFPGQGRPHIGLPGLVPEVEGVSGEYFVKCKPRQPRRWAKDAEAAQRLWQVSEQLVGLAPASAGTA